MLQIMDSCYKMDKPSPERAGKPLTGYAHFYWNEEGSLWGEIHSYFINKGVPAQWKSLWLNVKGPCLNLWHLQQKRKMSN